MPFNAAFRLDHKRPRDRRPSRSNRLRPPKDAVEISSAGQLLDKLSKSPQVRAERLAQIKAAIDAGQYDTDEKLEAALMNLFQSMVNERDHN